MQARLNTRRKVEGINRKISIRLKWKISVWLEWKVLNVCVGPAYLYCLEKVEYAQKQLQRIQVGENKRVGIIVGERVDRR